MEDIQLWINSLIFSYPSLHISPFAFSFHFVFSDLTEILGKTKSEKVQGVENLIDSKKSSCILNCHNALKWQEN